MRLPDRTEDRHPHLPGFALILVMALAACAEPQLEECEEGVSGLSGATTLVPANC
ncbi:MAG: hypothetical protein H5U18_10705 [Rhodobacteraceae bacterium]|nr:hypothetical protein [Paracoccaceae bacterium]